MSQAKRRAVITGLGPITSVGIGREGFWNGIARRKKAASARSRAFDSSIFNAHCAAEIPDWVPEEFFPPHRLKRLDRYAQFSVASAKLALDDAGITWSRENPQHRVGVSFGTALGGIANAESEHAHFLKKGSRAGEPDARAAGLRRLGAYQHRDRVWFSRRRHDELEQLRQRHDRGRRSASLHPRRFRRRHRGRRRGIAAQPAHFRRVCFHQDDEPIHGRSGARLPAIRSVARRFRHGRRRGLARSSRNSSTPARAARTFTPRCSVTV